MRILSRLLKFFAVGSVTLFLAACYGVQVMYGPPANVNDGRGTIKAVDDEGNPIPGLKVTVYSDTATSEGRTDADGLFSYDVGAFSVGQMTITDTDGQDNGGTFDPKTCWVDGSLEPEKITLTESD